MSFVFEFWAITAFLQDSVVGPAAGAFEGLVKHDPVLGAVCVIEAVAIAWLAKRNGKLQDKLFEMLSSVSVAMMQGIELHRDERVARQAAMDRVEKLVDGLPAKMREHVDALLAGIRQQR